VDRALDHVHQAKLQRHGDSEHVPAAHYQNMVHDSDLDEALGYRPLVYGDWRQDVPHAIEGFLVLLCAIVQRGKLRAFASQHAADSTSFYIFDEASAIPEKIYDVAMGGLTDGEPMIFPFGNPTRSQGTFHRITFGEERKRWNVRSIDSRNCKFSNKELIKEWEQDRGEDSDFFRVRVKGLPPRASDSQFIDADRVLEGAAQGSVCDVR
jgi:hypothetical protein